MSSDPRSSERPDGVPAPAVSVVSTMYKSRGYLEEFCGRVAASCSGIAGGYELILVNDGSPDDSLAVARSLQARYDALTVVDLSRNYGHHPAILAGLAQARGERVFLLDCDLEERPEWIADLQALMDREQADVVYGQQRARKGGLFEAATGSLFYRLFNWLSETKVPASWTTARLMSRRYVDALLQFGERELFLGGTFVLAGFRQLPFLVDKGSRTTSTYSLRKRLILFVNALASFSPRPLHLIFGMGATVTVVAVFAFVSILYRALRGETLIGWASVMASIWLFGGLTIFSLGLIGIYLGKVLIETKRRPLYVVRAVHRGPGR